MMLRCLNFELEWALIDYGSKHCQMVANFIKIFTNEQIYYK